MIEAVLFFYESRTSEFIMFNYTHFYFYSQLRLTKQKRKHIINVRFVKQIKFQLP